MNHLQIKGLIIALLLASNFLAAQRKIHVDTLSRADLNAQMDSAHVEDMLFKLLHKQALELAKREDSIMCWRLENDTTSVAPFHIGYRDSILMSAERTEQRFFLKRYGLANQPAAWTKHYVFSAEKPNDGLTLKNKAGSKSRIAKSGGMLLVIPRSIAQEPVNAEMTIAVIEPERSLVSGEKFGKNKKLAVKGYQRKWYKELTIMLQLTQNYLTKNWYTGGSSSFSTLGIISGKLEYNDLKKITWENTLEWRSGAAMNDADTLRKISTNEDVFKLYSKFNYKAVSKLYYSASAEFVTQFFDNYKDINSNVLVTTFFSPVRFNLNAGIDYKPVKGLSIALSPMSFKFVYVSDTLRIKQTDFSIPVGQKSLKEIGSSLRIEYSYKPVREFALDTKMYLYTNYKKVEFDLEVVANLIISRYFSTRISLHPRYDNTVILTGDEHAKLQFKEFVSVGFTHRFK